MNEYIRLRYGFNTLEEYVEAEFDKLYEVEEEQHGDNPKPMVLDQSFSYEIKKAIINFGDPESFGDKFFIAATKKKTKEIEKAVLNAIAILEKYPGAASHFGVTINPFIEYTPYETDTQRTIAADYNADFINKLEQNGLTQTKAKEIYNYLTNK